MSGRQRTVPCLPDYNSSYNLCPTMYEYWSACCYTTNIRSEAKKLLKRRTKLEEENGSISDRGQFETAEKVRF